MSRRWWTLVWALCLLFVAIIAVLWWRAVETYTPAAHQLVDAAAVRGFLDAHRYPGEATEPRVEIPTGVFIQSIKFENATDVHLTGYIWQRYDTTRHAALLADNGDFTDDPGVVVPEQVASATDPLTEAYRRRDGDVLTIGWAVDVIVRQPFDYARYPLDEQHVWLRMWHRAFDRNVVLVPDLRAYDATGRGLAFGLDRELVPGGWHIQETLFRYVIEDYDTDFGIAGYVGQRRFPELYFEVVMEREFVNAFIINLIPLIVVIALLFSIMLTVTAEEKRASVFGFSTTGALGMASALFFVVIVAHVQLREQISSHGVVYLEWFFIVTYLAILFASLDVYLFTAGHDRGGPRLIFHRDNLVPKLVFLPVILAALAGITVVFFA